MVSALGRGGMGEVYRAEDLKLGESVALKFLPEGVERDARRLAELLQEARVARKVTHPHICRVHDVAETEDGLHFISMEYVDGEDLSSLLRRIGRLPQSKALEIARECLQALTAAHDASVLHRDLKPANIMLDGSGRVRITDFGLASAMGTQSRGGTPAYMAPELFDGQKGTTQSDLYALGLVFYELFTGRRAFSGNSFDRLAQQHRTAQPPTPSEIAPQIDARLDALILSCLDKNPVRRPASLQRLDQTLEALQGSVGEDATGATEVPSADGDSFASWRSVPRRSRFLVLGLVGVLAAVAVTVGLLNLPWGGAHLEAPSAATSPPAESTAPAVEVRPGLALLPIRNLTEDTDAAWIGLAMTEILFSELSIGGHHRLIPLHQVDEALVELGLHEQAAFQSADLQRLQRRLGVQRVMVGSYSRILVDESEGLLRVDLRLVDVEGDHVLATHGATGTAKKVVELALKVGATFRQELAIQGLSADQALAVRLALPDDPRAARLYVEGRSRLRHLDLNEAQRLFTQAVDIEPQHPLLHAALAEVWWKLGFEPRARAEMADALRFSADLPLRERQKIEARAAKYDHRLDDAIPILERLIAADPDQLDDRVELIESQIGRGAHLEAQAALAKARDLPPPLGDHPILDHLEARMHQGMGNFEQQQQLAQSAAEKGEQLEAFTLVAAARLREAVGWWHLGEPEAEAKAVEQARSLYERLGNITGVARCLHHLGNSQFRRGDLDGSRRLLLRAKEIYEDVGHDLSVGSLLLNLGYIEFLRGNHEVGISKIEHSVDLFRSVGNHRSLGEALNNLGGLLLMQGQLREAFEPYREALELFDDIGYRSGSAAVLNNLGEIQFYLGELDGARAAHQEAQVIAREMGSFAPLGYAIYRLAEVDRIQDQLIVARSRYEEAIEILEKAGDRMAATEARLGLARVALREGDPDSAERLASEAEQFFRSAQSQELQYLAAIVRARVRLERKSFQEARRMMDEVRLAVAELDQPRVRFEAELLEAQVLQAEGFSDRALEVLTALAKSAGAAAYVGFEQEAKALALEIEGQGAALAP